MANLTHVELITPERLLFSGEAEAVVMRTDGGDITFLANHMDYIAAVDICVVRIQGVQRSVSTSEGVAQLDASPVEAAKGEPASTSEVRAAVHGGFVMVAENRVTIAAGVAELAEDIDVARAERALESAEAAGGDPQLGAVAAPATEQGASEQVSEVVGLNAAAARARARLQAAAQLEANLSHM